MIGIVGLVVGLLCLQLILVLRQLASISVPQWRWRVAPVASAWSKTIRVVSETPRTRSSARPAS